MLKILQTDSENLFMKTKISNLIFLILFVLCSISIIKAQNDTAPPKSSGNKKAEIIETAQYYFVFQIDGDSKITLSIQNSEDVNEFGNAEDADVLSNFFLALKNSGNKSVVKKQALDPFVIIKADENLNYSTLTAFLQKARDLSVHEIKIYSSKNTFESFISVAKKPNPKDRPNPLTLIAEIKTDKKVTLNNDEIGNLDDLSELKNTLIRIFKEREDVGAFREGTNEVEKTVLVKAPASVQFSEIIKLIKALKETGAQPVELLIDDIKYL